MCLTLKRHSQIIRNGSISDNSESLLKASWPVKRFIGDLDLVSELKLLLDNQVT